MMTAALGEKDSYTFAHAQRVAAYCRRIALRAGLSGADLHYITWGGLLHDVGKLGLSDRIFTNKQAALSQEMIGEVQTHPLIGSQMLRQIQLSAHYIRGRSAASRTYRRQRLSFWPRG